MIKEALIIRNKKPVINKQFDNFTNILKLYDLGNSSDRTKYVKHPDNFSKESGIPDMKQILEKFGIDTTKFKHIPVPDYSA